MGRPKPPPQTSCEECQPRGFTLCVCEAIVDLRPAARKRKEPARKKKARAWKNGTAMAGISP